MVQAGPGRSWRALCHEVVSTEFDKLLDSILKLASIQAFPSAFVFVISGTHS